MGIQHHVKHGASGLTVSGDGQGMRRKVPIRLVQSDTMPLNAGSAYDLIETHILIFVQSTPVKAIEDEVFNKAVQVTIFLKQRPVEPTDFIVLTVGVVVSPVGCDGPRPPSGAWARPAKGG